MYAIIETGGKQYKVQEGDVLYIEKLNAAEGEVVSFDRVFLVSKERWPSSRCSIGCWCFSFRESGETRQRRKSHRL